jgi:transcriptional regulator with XRE-family HTH domain
VAGEVGGDGLRPVVTPGAAYRGDVADRSNPLGDFLRARRELVDPAAHGLPPAVRRRVAGLRREELALLAGMSAHYYARLEQGRDRHPSPPVLDALARVLDLDAEARAHLGDLAASAGTPRVRRRPQPERVRPEVALLLSQWTDQAAIVLGRHRDVLAANALATALVPAFRPGVNLLRYVFLEPAAREVYLDWEDIAWDGVSALRASVGGDVDDVRLAELVGDLSLRSAEFRRMWASHTVRTKTGGVKRIRNPLVGRVDLRFEPFAVPQSDRQLLCLFFAEPGSADAQSLRLLSQLTGGA